MHPYKLFDERQSQAEACQLSFILYTIGLPEHVEDSRQCLGRDTDSIIFNGEHTVTFKLSADPDKRRELRRLIGTLLADQE